MDCSSCRYVNGHEFDLPTPGYHSFTFSPEDSPLIDYLSFIGVLYGYGNTSATIPYDSVSCEDKIAI